MSSPPTPFMPWVYSRDKTFLCRSLADSDFEAKAPKESRYHARAEASHLYELLTAPTSEAPRATKNTARDASPPSKDPPCSFYRAQCIHYGLQPFVAKATAKKHLLAAFGSGQTLVVPLDVVKRREELQQEWVVAKEAEEAKDRVYEAERERQRQEAELPMRLEREKDRRDAVAKFTTIVGDAVTATRSAKRLKKGAQITAKDKRVMYSVAVPRIPEEWITYGGMWLKMVQSPNTGHLWIHFEFNSFAGVIRSSVAPTRTHEPCSLTWRALTDGKLLYGADNTGVLTFLGDGKIHGTLMGSGLVDFEFAGERQDFWLSSDEIAKLNDSLLEWKQKYRAINSISDARTAAERAERIARHGSDFRMASEAMTRYPSIDPPEASDSEASVEDEDEDDDENESGSPGKLTTRDTEGKFRVYAPSLAKEWPEHASDMWLKIAHSKSGRHVWISFDLGVVSGVMRGSAPPKKSTTPCTLTWRGSEQGEGHTTFGKSNTACITFLGDGQLRGTIRGGFLGTKNVEFRGKAVPSPNTVWCMSVPGWKAKYRGINSAAQEHAAAARWGKWVSDAGTQGAPEESDSDAGGRGEPVRLGIRF
ncbi:hypothetical protein EXIGLDRAFT_766971 [Exidia glandulosa HHB12029]|uniref:Uncharacterized protein n=1 Tax=Exidia glandulosa HHB12029 TaxID=1314781 RepID=A0A165JA65_EXIGL|nr:hypothetical protein EXIGLDRAFT_766971 [Exidia glandulosa HHB12029]